MNESQRQVTPEQICQMLLDMQQETRDILSEIQNEMTLIRSCVSQIEEMACSVASLHSSINDVKDRVHWLESSLAVLASGAGGSDLR